MNKVIMTETEELGKVLLQLIVGVVKANLDDGKISLIEASQIVFGNIVPLYKGIEGIVNIKAEFQQADASDYTHLLASLKDELVPIFGEKSREAAEDIHNLVLAFVKATQSVKAAVMI